MNSYKHSGAFGDLIYSLAVARYLGQGKFYLHLNQINWIGQHYYGSQPDPVHQGRLRESDYLFMRDLMLAQPWITDFTPLDGQAEITHNLDRFRPLFVGHPGNYVDIYSVAMGITDPSIRQKIRTEPWLTVASPRKISGKPVVINRTARWLPPTLSPQWAQWRDQGWEDQSIFVGTEQEHELFQKATGWQIPYRKTRTMLELAEVIAGADEFVGNQSVALALAIGLGQKFHCEHRRDLPLERNECYFPNQKDGNYF